MSYEGSWKGSHRGLGSSFKGTIMGISTCRPCKARRFVNQESILP